MLAALIAGQNDPGQLADLALGTLRGKIPQLRRALDGSIRDHHRFLLKRLLVQWRFVENETELIDQRLEQIGKEEPEIAEAVARWDTTRGRSHCCVGLSGRDGHQHGAVPFGEACG